MIDGLAEVARITAAGGFVEFGRVCGNLALSRALGDFSFKTNKNLPAEQQIVTAFPEIMDHDNIEDVDLAILACDGIWDCLTNDQVLAFIQSRIAAGMELTKICEEIIDHCLAPTSLNGIGTISLAWYFTL